MYKKTHKIIPALMFNIVNLVNETKIYEWSITTRAVNNINLSNLFKLTLTF